MSEMKVGTITVEQLQARVRTGTIKHFWNVLTAEYFTGELIPGSRRLPTRLILNSSTINVSLPCLR